MGAEIISGVVIIRKLNDKLLWSFSSATELWTAPIPFFKICLVHLHFARSWGFRVDSDAGSALGLG